MDLAVLGYQLNLIILKVLSKLNYSIIQYHYKFGFIIISGNIIREGSTYTGFADIPKTVFTLHQYKKEYTHANRSM